MFSLRGNINKAPAKSHSAHQIWWKYFLRKKKAKKQNRQEWRKKGQKSQKSTETKTVWRNKKCQSCLKWKVSDLEETMDCESDFDFFLLLFTSSKIISNFLLRLCTVKKSYFGSDFRILHLFFSLLLFETSLKSNQITHSNKCEETVDDFRIWLFQDCTTTLTFANRWFFALMVIRVFDDRRFKVTTENRKVLSSVENLLLRFISRMIFKSVAKLN